MARTQFTTQESNNFLLEYQGHTTMSGLFMDFGHRFLNARQPALCHERRIYKKVMEKE